MLETLLGVRGKQIVVANVAQEQTVDLMDDLRSIIYSFAARLYGLQSAKHRTQRLIAALEGERD